MDFFSINELQKAMEEDSDPSSHPISFEVKTAADIRRIFDPISYSKGASIIRMTQGFLGDDAFWGALKKYLEKFQYSNAVHDDLWNVMTEFGHKYQTLPDDLTVETIMDSWTLNAGYPILYVQLNGTSLNITQQHYQLPIVNASDTQTWHIPITYVVNSNNTMETNIVHSWLPNSTEIILPNAVQPDQWFYFNSQRTGYYRVNYDYASWLTLIKYYEHLPNTTIAQLVDDSLNLARAEVITYDIPLTFLLHLQNTPKDSSMLPWTAAVSGIEYLTNMLNREPAYEQFRVSKIHIGRKIFNYLERCRQ